MVAGEIELEETELIVLQNLLGGDNFGAGFDDFNNRNMNLAQFRAKQRGNVYRTTMVDQAREDGRLARLHFRIDVFENRDENSEDDDSARQIKVVVDRNGYFRSRQRAPDELLDRFFGNLAIVLEYRDKLVPINQHIDKYVDNLNIGMGETRNGVRSETQRAFQQLIRKQLTVLDFEKDDIPVYSSIIVNTGIKLLDVDLNSDDFPNITGFDGSNIDYQDGRISDFFEVYGVNIGDGFRPDFDLLAGHLNHILSYSDGYDSLTGMLEFVENTYDI